MLTLQKDVEVAEVAELDMHPPENHTHVHTKTGPSSMHKIIPL